MTNQEMRNIKESLGVEMFKMNYKAGINENFSNNIRQ